MRRKTRELPEGTKFYSDEPVHLALVSGHTALVTEEPVELHPRFHEVALRMGCFALGPGDKPIVGNPVDASDTKPGTAREQLLARIEKAVRGFDPDDDKSWTKDGRPDVRAIERAIGSNIDAADRDEVWSRISAELDDDEEGGEGDDA